jgi:hypothetical protein
MVKEKTDLRVSVDGVLAARIRDAAARLNVSASALVRCQMQGFVDAEERNRNQGNTNFLILAEFSLGMRQAASAMHALKLHSYQDLLGLLNIARLPCPRIPEQQIELMVDSLETLAQT